MNYRWIPILGLMLINWLMGSASRDNLYFVWIIRYLTSESKKPGQITSCTAICSGFFDSDVTSGRLE